MPKATSRTRPIALMMAAPVLAMLGGCLGDDTQSIYAVSSAGSPVEFVSRDEAAATLDERSDAYRRNVDNPQTALRYAAALRALDRMEEGSAVLEQAAMRHPDDKILVAAYGKSLIDVRQYDKAAHVLQKAHTADQPDWRVLSAQGTIADQTGDHGTARTFYSSALKISPGNPVILTNLGLSYAASRDYARAEATLRDAASSPAATARTRANLAQVLVRSGRDDEARAILSRDLPPDQVENDIALMRQASGRARPGPERQVIISPGQTQLSATERSRLTGSPPKATVPNELGFNKNIRATGMQPPEVYPTIPDPMDRSAERAAVR